MTSVTPQSESRRMTSSPEQRALAQSGPAGLGLATDPAFRVPPHIDLINAAIVEAVATAEPAPSPQVLVVEVPPRHGKSSLISELTPAWFLGMYPDRKVILTSYEADFAATWGRRSRALLEEHGAELYGVAVDQDSRARNRWDIKGRKGGMMTAGVGGAVTGKGAHLLIIDDPIKNAEQAQSETIRAKHIDWWLTTARTRLEPGAVVALLMTRWHESDLGGYMLDNEDRVREIRLPALAEPEDPLGRAPGEALWPERYDAANLARTREQLGPYWWSALYMGKPSPDEGGIFRREDFQTFTVEPDGTAVLSDGKRFDPQHYTKRSYVDLAVSEKETADYTVLTECWITVERHLLIANVHRERVAGPDQPDWIAERYAGTLKVERIGYQAALIQALLRAGLPVEPLDPDKDKVTRAAAAGALYRAERVYHRAGAPWLHDLEAELLAFPAGEHDDQVDTIAYAARDLPSVGARRRKQREKQRGITAGWSAGNV